MTKLKPINLIPGEAIKKSLLKVMRAVYKKNKLLLNFSILVLVILSAITAQAIVLNIYKSDLTRSKQTLQESKARLGKLQSQFLQLERTKSNFAKEELSIRQKLELLFSTSSKDRRYSRLLAFIASLTPQDLWINHCTLTQDEIKIIGSTLNNQLITQFMNELDKSNAFKNSRFTSSEKQLLDSHTIYNFEISTEPLWNSTQADSWGHMFDDKERDGLGNSNLVNRSPKDGN